MREISHVQLPVKRLDKAIAWYEEVLGCELAGHFGVFAVVKFKGDKVTLFLWESADDTTTTFRVNVEPFPAFGFQVEDGEDMDRLCKAIPEGKATRDEEGRRFLKFFDPDGNMLVAHTE
ncbi:hypothetical protein J31TS4_23750 [Paenibacillus sp. J31TS4]|uniref:VOC family protein n=1 Tax=Paenibacillus sp. J31TS4 TaxID=2807195 RepID=UPI001B0CFC4D|nr:VOC family protein [Paenibacillus sp. J31TS4]GIP39095.1 hypothetical protein J31TS4_23750 [Paenibacillus sp. J31TS4]